MSEASRRQQIYPPPRPCNREPACPRCGDEDRPCLCDGLTDAEWERQEREGRKFEEWKNWESEK